MGLRPYARGMADWIFGNKDPEGSTGIYRDITDSEDRFGFGQGINQLGNIYGNIGDMARAGRMGQLLGSDATNAGLGFAGNMMGQANNFLGMIPGVLDASNYYLGKGTDALKQFGGVMDMASGNLADARNVFRDISNPLAYNSLYQSALGRQQNSIDSMLASRGLGASGPGLQAEAASNLSDQFGMRQRQEQLGALDRMNAAGGTAANVAQGYGSLAGTLAQIPGSIYSGMAGIFPSFASMAGLPQSIIGTGMDLYRTGGSMGLESLQDYYNVLRGPQLAGGQLINSSN